ncbi:MAG: hypothetical protein P4L92_06575 [Rudaea sp.]|nr:hypothetical protein [Rudaea sp.]
MVTAILYVLVMLAVAFGVGALIIMLATRIVAGFTPKFLMALVAAIVETIAAGIVSYVLNMVLGAGGLSSLVSLVIVFVLYAAILNALVKRPDGAQMGFGKACLVTLVQIIIEIVLSVILFFVFGSVLIGMLGTMSMH